jgi:hypothetical protein
MASIVAAHRGEEQTKPELEIDYRFLAASSAELINKSIVEMEVVAEDLRAEAAPENGMGLRFAAPLLIVNRNAEAGKYPYFNLGYIDLDGRHRLRAFGKNSHTIRTLRPAFRLQCGDNVDISSTTKREQLVIPNTLMSTNQFAAVGEVAVRDYLWEPVEVKNVSAQTVRRLGELIPALDIMRLEVEAEDYHTV